MSRSPLRPAFFLVLLCGAFGACTCVTPPATPVTLKVTNDLDWDIFVPNDLGQGGLTVQAPSSSGDPSPIGETPACACLSCASACDTSGAECSCETPAPMVHRIRVGQSFSRTFDGTEHVATRADCGTGDLGPLCFQDGAPLPAGTYELQLCFAANATGADANRDNFAATLSSDALTCITKRFTYPDEKEVDIAPPPPPPCGAANACPEGQLCQKGVCSASCLANDVPPIGARWDVTATLVDDEGFFTSSGTGLVRSIGTGQVAQAVYNASDLRLTVTRALGAGRVTGTVEVGLPSSVETVAFQPGETVSILFVQAGDDRKNAGAAVIRDGSGVLLLAADQGRGGPLLTGADLAPFSVSPGGEAFACDGSDLCHRRTHHQLDFAAEGQTVTVDPGQTEPMTVGGESFNATAIENYIDASGNPRSCDLAGVAAYAIAQKRSF